MWDEQDRVKLAERNIMSDIANKNKAMEKLRDRLDKLEIELGTYKTALQLQSERDITPARAEGIAEFFRRFIHGNT
jgi:hypothetical protein